MTNTPSNDDVARARDLMLTYIFKGDMARRVVKYLISAIGTQQRVCAQDISEHGGPKGDSNVCPFMSRMREQLADFYDYHPVGRKERCRASLPADDRGNYELQLTPNDPPNNLVPAFWGQHLSRGNALVVYPEMQQPVCSGDAVAPADTPANVVSIRPMPAPDDQGSGVPSANTVVSASFMRSVLRLSRCFRTWDVGVTATGIRPAVDMLDCGDLIVLATPGSMPSLLGNLEAAARMRTATDGVSIITETREGRKIETHADTPENGVTGDAFEMVKWGVLTRHHYRFQRTLTVLAAKDEIAVEAMVQFLINEEAMLMLARELRCGKTFPDHFQVLFRMHVFKGHPYAREMTVVQAIDLGVNGKAPSLKKSA
jgi:hypothetical protein